MNANSTESGNKNLFSKDIPLYITLLSIFLSGLLVYFIFPHPGESSNVNIASQPANCFAEMDILRNKDFKFTHPAYLYDVTGENSKLNALKDQLNLYISQTKTSKGLTDISVYFRNLNDGAWFEINGGAMYNPASLMKVPYLISILKEAELNPKILDKQVLFEKHFASGNNQNIRDFNLPEHAHYSLRQLLYYMIANSDNDATMLVSQNVNNEIMSKLFSDLGIPPTPLNGGEYFINVLDYSKFFRVLYNSSYLTDPYSEFALELLTKCSYKDGLMKGINFTYPVAHKFGERIINQVQQLHETGIFFEPSQPYLLSVMSSGHDLKELSSILSQVSQIVSKECNK